ncbi:MAG: ATP synthase F1 subunit delta [Myxococcales bacterium]|nr:ATP synthase F1 subunit delta [Myxococcales bacterium]MCB9550514.1 ATP synthase F1 subunit delta [Myxococcales bacterium]
MRAPTIADRYARALLDIGVDRKNYEQLGRELDRVVALFEHDELRQLFHNPKFDIEARKGVLGELLRRVMVSPICKNFLFLLVDRNRIGYLPEIVAAYHDLSDAHAGRVRARVTVASRLGESDIARLRTVLQQATGKQVIVDQEEDPAILGGVITRIEGRIYDGSVRTQLETMRARLKQGR